MELFLWYLTVFTQVYFVAIVFVICDTVLSNFFWDIDWEWCYCVAVDHAIIWEASLLCCVMDCGETFVFHFESSVFWST